MGAMYTTTINEVDRKTNKSFSTGKSVETAGPLALLPEDNLFGNSNFDEFSSSNPFAQATVDYSAYANAPVNNSDNETSYAIAMAGMLSMGSDFSSGDVGCFASDGGFSGDCGGISSGGGFSGGDCGGSCGGGGFSASC